MFEPLLMCTLYVNCLINRGSRSWIFVTVFRVEIVIVRSLLRSVSHILKQLHKVAIIIE